MPLRDHFHEPLAGRRHFTGLHGTWATYLTEEANAHLPEGYFAEPNVQFGIEIDVAAWEEPGGPPRAEQVPTSSWAPPAPQLTVPFAATTDVAEVRIFRNEGGPVLAGAVELVSPANKDRADSREAFVSKCAFYVQQGVGLAVVDIVTERRSNLHRELLARIAPGSAALDAELYAVAYRPVRRNDHTELDIWQEPLSLGRSLPTLPLWLRGGVCLALRLEETYERSVRMLRIPA